MNKTADDHLFFPDTKYIEICMFSSIKDRFPAMIIISLRQTLGYKLRGVAVVKEFLRSFTQLKKTIV